MNRIKLYDKYFVPYISYEKLSEAIDKVAQKINTDFKDCPEDDIPVILCVLNGSIMFTAELLKRFDFNCELSSIRLSSYNGTSTTGEIKQITGLTTDIRGRRVIVIEDIVDTGLTIVALHDLIQKAGAREIRVCTMLLKPEVYKQSVKLDYVGLEIANKFIVGFGLDYNQIGRNFKDIYILD